MKNGKIILSKTLVGIQIAKKYVCNSRNSLGGKQPEEDNQMECGLRWKMPRE